MRTQEVFLLTFIIFVSLFLPVSIFGIERFSTSVSYAPGFSDFIRTDTSPTTHTIESMAFGLESNTMYLFRNKLGVGLMFHWGVVTRLTVRQGSDSMTSNGWLGTVSFLSLKPEFLYTPVRSERSTVIVGLAPSVTMKYYSSDFGGNAYNVYGGMALMASWHYYLNKHFFLNTGFQFDVDFIQAWDPEVSFFHLQSHFAFGIGYYF